MAAFQKTKMPYNPLTSASNVSLSSNSSKNYRYGTHIFSYKPGKVIAIEDIPVENIKKYVEKDGRLYLSTYDGIFLAWNNIQLYKE